MLGSLPAGIYSQKRHGVRCAVFCVGSGTGAKREHCLAGVIGCCDGAPNDNRSDETGLAEEMALREDPDTRKAK